MNKAAEIFRQVPKTHNCAQSVAAGCAREDMVPELAACGGGRAPEGRCGALHAALLMSPEESRTEICRQFRSTAGSELCREIRASGEFPCVKCVELAATLAGEKRNSL